MVSRIQGGEGGRSVIVAFIPTIGSGGTTYFGINSSASSVTEGKTDIEMPFACNVRHYRLVVHTFTFDSTVTLTLRKEAGDTALTIIANASGTFTDLDDIVFFDASDDLNFEADATASSSGLFGASASFELIS